MRLLCFREGDSYHLHITLPTLKSARLRFSSAPIRAPFDPYSKSRRRVAVRPVRPIRQQAGQRSINAHQQLIMSETMAKRWLSEKPGSATMRLCLSPPRHWAGSTTDPRSQNCETISWAATTPQRTSLPVRVRVTGLSGLSIAYRDSHLPGDSQQTRSNACLCFGRIHHA